MSEHQLDFFSDIDVGADQGPSRSVDHALVLSEIDDDRLIAAIPESNIAHGCVLAAEAGRRRLAAAIPALANLCRRFSGFGTRRVVPEQAGAIEALAVIGGRDAAQVVSEIIERAEVQEPTLPVAVSAAARLHSILSPHVLGRLLRHAEPGIRANACRCARPLPELILILIDLLDDLDRRVATSAASALGRMGRIEALPMLKRLLCTDPSEDVIDAVSSVADEECAVVLGRIARSQSTLADAALISLDNIDHPRAPIIAAAIRRAQPPQQNSGSGRAEDGASQQSSCP